MSQKAARGTKRTCQGCAARFYDFDNSPIICPMCGAEFKLAPVDPQEEEIEAEEVDTPVAAAAVPVDEPEESDEADELADIETDDVDISSDEDDNTFIEDDEDPNASVSAIVPSKSGDGDDDN